MLYYFFFFFIPAKLLYSETLRAKNSRFFVNIFTQIDALALLDTKREYLDDCLHITFSSLCRRLPDILQQRDPRTRLVQIQQLESETVT